MGLGAAAGIVLAGALAIAAFQMLIPWETICATVAPTQEMVRLGSALIVELQAWLVKAEEFLSAGGSTAQSTEVREGLGGLVDRARGALQTTATVAVDVVAAPLMLLIDAAQILLESIQDAVDAARDSLESIDQSRCG